MFTSPTTRTLTVDDLADASVVQTFQGSIWIIAGDQLRKLDFWADSCDERMDLTAALPYITAWRESGRNGTEFGRWRTASTTNAAEWLETIEGTKHHEPGNTEENTREENNHE